MPAYNVENYIAASIDSVVNQTYTNWELIIVDDGSTDGTAGIINEFVEKDYRIKYLYQTNARQAKARNTGIAIAQGSILAFLDSDDLWLPNKLEVTLAAFDLEKYDLIFTNSYTTDDEIIDVSSIAYKQMKIANNSYYGKEALKLFIQGNKIPILTVLVKKSVVLNVGSFDIACVPAEDYDLWIRLLKSGSTFLSIANITAVYRIQQSSSTASDRLATPAVVKSLAKNFSYKELEHLQMQSAVKNWLLRWIDICLTKNNIAILKDYIHLFNFKGLPIKLLFFSHKLFSFELFKRILRKTLKSY